ncbi:hypothetical protein QJS04_geneDACA017167 [Acorus gramineus]|uniref:Uncharacterized protein n=1 Tax=Acorus gramineus TaxID=55184 RepID=A0AAV9BQW0_ACOGR|nr:hypothetical protein QJS04_geneDACA017167 [Acorus gramineus]
MDVSKRGGSSSSITEISEVPHEGDLILLGSSFAEVSNSNVLDLFESFHVSVGQFLHADVSKEQLKNKIRILKGGVSRTLPCP